MLNKNKSSSVSILNVHFLSFFFSFYFFVFQDPKGGKSRMLSFRFSRCPQERVWQESSEWLFFFCFISVLQSSGHSRPSGPRVMFSTFTVVNLEHRVKDKIGYHTQPGDP